MSYQPQPGSLPSRVCEWFARNPEEELTASDIGRKYNVPAANVTTTLSSAAAAQWLKRAKGSDGIMVYAAGPKLPHAPAAGAPIAPPPAPFAKGSGALKRPRLPPLDVAALTVRRGVPIQDRQADKGRTRHDAIFALLDAPDTMVDGLPIAYRSAVTKALQTWQQRHKGQKFNIRALADGKTFGIWRVA